MTLAAKHAADLGTIRPVAFIEAEAGRSPTGTRKGEQ